MQKATLPSAALTETVNQLPALKQDLFYQEYNGKKKSNITSFVLWFFGLHYLYYSKWFLQILFWFTVGGLGIWWLIDITRVRKNVTNWNHSLAVDLVNKV